MAARRETFVIGMSSVSHWIVVDRGPGSGRRRFGVESVADSEEEDRVALEKGGTVADRAHTMSEAAELAEELRACADVMES